MEVKLRKFEENDMNQFTEWYTKNTEWQKWDAPWEWTDYIFSPSEVARKKKIKTSHIPCFEYEIIFDNRHVGWIEAYYMTSDYKWNDLEKTDKIAIGIVLPDPSIRHQGIGKAAYVKYIQYFRDLGIKKLYTQTWSGNLSMIHLAESCGFREINRFTNLRVVDSETYDALTFCLEL